MLHAAAALLGHVCACYSFASSLTTYTLAIFTTTSACCLQRRLHFDYLLLCLPSSSDIILLCCSDKTQPFCLSANYSNRVYPSPPDDRLLSRAHTLLSSTISFLCFVSSSPLLPWWLKKISPTFSSAETYSKKHRGCFVRSQSSFWRWLIKVDVTRESVRSHPYSDKNWTSSLRLQPSSSWLAVRVIKGVEEYVLV